MAHQVFICYSSKDKLTADAACASLEASRVRCWIAPRDVLAGVEWGEAIIDAISQCRILVLIFSSDANASVQVRREVERAVSKGKIILPFRIEDALPSGAMEYAISTTHWLDALTPPLEKHLAKLSETVSQLLLGGMPGPGAGKSAAAPQGTVPERRSSLRPWTAGAAAVLVIAALGSWTLLHRQREAAAAMTARGVPAPAPAPTPPIVALKLNPKDALKYAWIPPGRFTMGCSPTDKDCFDDESPAHDVVLTKGFWMGQTEVTQDAYHRVMGKNPSHHRDQSLPVEDVNWNEAQAYCKAAGGRLPSEAEWEYAARGGDPRGRYGTLGDIAWYKDNSGQEPHPVGQKQANAYSLLDMLGNAQELTADWFGAYSSQAEQDPHGPVKGTFRVVRGGGASDSETSIRATARDKIEIFGAFEEIGFRCALDTLP